jgi:hypothetical protein
MSDVQCEIVCCHVEGWQSFSSGTLQKVHTTVLKHLNTESQTDGFPIWQKISQYISLCISYNSFHNRSGLLILNIEWWHSMLSLPFWVKMAEPAFITNYDVITLCSMPLKQMWWHIHVSPFVFICKQVRNPTGRTFSISQSFCHFLYGVVS